MLTVRRTLRVIGMHRFVDSKGFTLIELMMVVGVVGVLAAVAVPGLMRSRIAANETSAVGSLRTIVSAQEDFAAGNGGYADDLASLAAVCPGSEQPFVSPDLGSNGVLKSGYTFAVQPGITAVAGTTDCFGNQTQTSYYASATPLSPSVSGNFAYATNVAAAIWQDATGVPPAEPFAVTATVSPYGK